ncbi:arginine/serine-rich coiled-coil protein 2 [Anthonomus grandis grandis]|uniref:arginine/serine-rich coiled-coil protein 2 n=1 Tax=Anthonomus grandis grandis TaxID=2921223 RepID=UPI002165CF59|nr:arginine/serine-rich coiled-coil protein 2 [Anthonomus grandis grandis]
MSRYDWNNPPPPGTELEPNSEAKNEQDSSPSLVNNSPSPNHELLTANVVSNSPKNEDSSNKLRSCSASVKRSPKRSSSGSRSNRRRKRSRSHTRWSGSRDHRQRSRSRHRRRKYSSSRSKSRSSSPEYRHYRSRHRRYSRSRSKSPSRSYNRRSYRSRSGSRTHSHRSHRSERDRSSRSHYHRHRRDSDYHDRNDRELDGDILEEEDMKIEDPDEEDGQTDDQPAVPFRNDGSFLEMFKKMQEEQKAAEEPPAEEAIKKPVAPLFGKRRGGKVLKTGLVAKVRNVDEDKDNPQDAWSVYMKEVRKYKEVHCDDDSKTRPLVK